MMDGAGKLITSTSEADGTFNFTVGRGEGASIYIPSFNGHEWDSYITSTVAAPALQSPSVEPTSAPSKNPTYRPSRRPSFIPTFRPTFSPTYRPTFAPSHIPSERPSFLPSTEIPTFTPSLVPSSVIPSVTLSVSPSTDAPTIPPTSRNSSEPTISPTSRNSSAPVSTSKRSLKALNTYSRDLSLAPICLFGDCTRGLCMAGTKCVYLNPFYSQCLLDPSTDRKSRCIANYGRCFNSTSTCCSDAFSCSGTPFQCNPVTGPYCRLANVPTSQPSHQPTKQPQRRPSKQPTCQPNRHPSKQPSKQPTSQPSAQRTCHLVSPGSNRLSNLLNIQQNNRLINHRDSR